MLFNSMNLVIGGIAIVLLMVGLAGQGLEMKRIRESTIRDEDLSSTNIFFNKRNIKWFMFIGAAFVLLYLFEPMQP